MSGSVEHIHIATTAGGSVRSLESIEATAGVGLAGDRYAAREVPFETRRPDAISR